MAANRTIAAVPDDDEVIDAEIVDNPPKPCPKYRSHNIDIVKKPAVLLVLVVAVYGAALAVEQLAAGALIIALMLVGYYVMPPFQCRDCGFRFD